LVEDVKTYQERSGGKDKKVKKKEKEKRKEEKTRKLKKKGKRKKEKGKKGCPIPREKEKATDLPTALSKPS
jgi:alpha-galactosidase/6-phospho-beta-glucosidase family protein